jgi:plasmid stabilization system protein ParE
MVCKVNWTLKAIETYLSNVEYLEKRWTALEAKNFTVAVEKKIKALSGQLGIGSLRNKKQQNIRHTVIHKRVSLIYRYKPLKKEIELLRFWNTYQNPKKLKSIR